MPGAASLAAGGALSAGAGMVYLATAASAVPLLPARQPEWLVRPVADTPAGGIAEAALDDLLGQAKSAQAVVLGPGLALEETTRRLVVKLVEQVEAPLVVDADALTAVGAHPGSVRDARGPRILTPHTGEMARLLHVEAATVEADRLGSAQRAAADLKAVVVLKGARTVVAEPGGRLFVIPTGNAGMATAGSGDVLAGIIGALAAQRLAPVAAAVLGAYVHGLAGDLARESLTELSLTASELTAHLGKAFHRLKHPGVGDPTHPAERGGGGT
jgi:NAD(P)H-hydrate epimerase